MAFYNHDLLKATHLLSNCRLGVDETCLGLLELFWIVHVFYLFVWLLVGSCGNKHSDRAIESMKKVMTKKDRKRFNARFEKRNRKRANPRVYHSVVEKRDGSKGWQGGPHLASTAKYTYSFCLAVYQCWLKAQPAQPAQPWCLFDIIMLSQDATKMVVASALLNVNSCESCWGPHARECWAVMMAYSIPDLWVALG